MNGCPKCEMAAKLEEHARLVARGIEDAREGWGETFPLTSGSISSRRSLNCGRSSAGSRSAASV
jgi:hypothetical protein